MTLYKYLFVGLTSSSDLQPHLIGEERESKQALQHHSREQSPLFFRGYSLADTDGWLVFTSQRCEKILWSWSSLCVGAWARVRQPRGRQRLSCVLVSTCTAVTSFAKILTHEWARESTHNASLMLLNCTSVSHGKGAVVTIWIFLLCRVCS